MVAGAGATKAFGEVVSLMQEAGSSLRNSKGVVLVRTPAVDAESELTLFTLLTMVQPETRNPQP